MRLWGSIAAFALAAAALTAAAEQEDGAPPEPPPPIRADDGPRPWLVPSGTIPDELTSRGGEPTRPPPAEGSSDLAWLQGLRMPDLQIRLADPVVEQLERIRRPGWWHDAMGRWLRRSGRYEPLVRRILREEGVPEDLYYVVMVESGFNPTARSRAGAAGLWQFMPASGAEQGLGRDHWVDERLDFERSTRAAAHVLGGLRERLGTWELALAAYNMGYYGLLATIRGYNTNDYWLLWQYEGALPYETRTYVPRIMAAALVARNAERFGYDPADREPPLAFDVLAVPPSTPLGRVARLTGTSPDSIRDLNPALRRGRTPPGTVAYQLRVPEGTARRAAAKLGTLRRAADLLTSHTLRVGEDLASVAKLYGVGRQKLARLNEIAPRTELEPGTVLVVPAKTPAAVDPAEPPVAVVPERHFSYRDRRRVFYQVVAGDSLERLARAFDATVDQICEWNDLDPGAALQPAMVLQVFVPLSWRGADVRFLGEGDVRVFVADTVELYEELARRRDRDRVVYRVRRGDTLPRLGKRYGLSAGLIARINLISQSETLEPGEELVLYVERRGARPRPAVGEPLSEPPERAVEEAEGIAAAEPTAPTPAAPAGARPVRREGPATPEARPVSLRQGRGPADASPAGPADAGPAGPADAAPAGPADVGPAPAADAAPVDGGEAGDGGVGAEAPTRRAPRDGGAGGRDDADPDASGVGG